MALFGLIYSVYKKAGETSLAKAHFWLHNIGLPIMQGTLFLELLIGNTSLTIGIIIGSLIVILGVILFVLNLFLNLREA
ncbi:Cytochrome-c oxidase OS=Ureibacillus acetophenoni OX=614649 GN=SAMN05877842_108113 PE=4 SV=1 [Ureibacillus acetophenoni]